MRYVIRRDDGTTWTTTDPDIAEAQSRDHDRHVTAKNF
jgi:hypothetical protein